MNPTDENKELRAALECAKEALCKICVFYKDYHFVERSDEAKIAIDAITQIHAHEQKINQEEKWNTERNQ